MTVTVFNRDKPELLKKAQSWASTGFGVQLTETSNDIDTTTFSVTTPMRILDGKQVIYLGYKKPQKLRSLYPEYPLENQPCCCDECHRNTDRVAFQYFLVDNQVKCYGSICAKKYFGTYGVSAEQAEQFYADFEELQDFCSTGQLRTVCLETMITAVAAATHNFTSWQKDHQTQNLVIELLTAPFSKTSKELMSKVKPVDMAEFTKEIYSVYKMPEDAVSESNFVRSIRFALIDPDHKCVYTRVLSRDAITMYGIFAVGKRMLAIKYMPGFLGQEGMKIKIDFTLAEVRSFDTDYGVTYMYVGADKDSHCVTFFTTRKGMDTMEIGKTYPVQGTIKDTSCRHDIDCTQLRLVRFAK